MKIAFVEILNFRKLKSARIDFSDETTLLVGANNSGKTSAMLALREFLGTRRGFTANDFTLSIWAEINKIGAAWANGGDQSGATASAWDTVLPSLDLWLDVEPTQIHYVRSLLPTLNWQGGRLGVRLRLEPKLVEELQIAFLTAFRAAEEVRKIAKKPDTLTVWPTDLKAFLDRKLRDHFTIKLYSLDPAKCVEPKNGIAQPQSLPEGSEPIEGNPLADLIRVDEISAQRGFSDSAGITPNADESRERRLLSEQLRTYYGKHLDVSDIPEPADLDALQAIEGAQAIFDQRLSTSFLPALEELSTLNYPGITDARLRITTSVRPVDGLNHSAAVQYDVLPASESGTLRLPENYNGLGYQNLISMVFRLMSFRDGWMRVGKARGDASKTPIPPLHLVLIEEPEAYLHVQVQQVFLRKAYAVLRRHPDLMGSTNLRTQIVVSTHSSHVAHEMPFASVRYFRRMQGGKIGGVPISAVVNLSEVFGPNDETAKFVTRYLQATHCDLFFADAAILVEGPAEKMLIPHFIRREFDRLHRSYVSLLQIGGSYAHLLEPLIAHLGLTTLVVTDIDSCELVKSRWRSVTPRRNARQKSVNATLRTWHPKMEMLDDLLDLAEVDKVKQSEDGSWSLRVAYQVPIEVEMTAGAVSEALCRTFEDSLVFENLALFRSLNGDGLIEAVRDALAEAPDAAQFSDFLCEELKEAGKGKFALDMLWYDKEANQLKPPRYIRDGLAWLQDQLRLPELAVGGASHPSAASAATATTSATGATATTTDAPGVDASAAELPPHSISLGSPVTETLGTSADPTRAAAMTEHVAPVSASKSASGSAESSTATQLSITWSQEKT